MEKPDWVQYNERGAEAFYGPRKSKLIWIRKKKGFFRDILDFMTLNFEYEYRWVLENNRMK